MPKDTDEKPLTIKDIHEALIPAMEKIFATRKDLEKSLTIHEWRLCAMMIAAMKEHGILSPFQQENIRELEVF